MQVHTVADLGRAVREARRGRGQTQQSLARELGVSVSWLSRFENGSPRLEAQLVLDAVLAAGLALTTGPADATATDADDVDLVAVFERALR